MTPEIRQLLSEVATVLGDSDSYGSEYLFELADRARAVLARYGSHPAPVPVAERLPGEGDCDAEGRCWFFTTEQDDGSYELVAPGMPYNGRSHFLIKVTYYSHWLPYWALPLPQEGQS